MHLPKFQSWTFNFILFFCFLYAGSVKMLNTKSWQLSQEWPDLTVRGSRGKHLKLGLHPPVCQLDFCGWLKGNFPDFHHRRNLIEEDTVCKVMQNMCPWPWWHVHLFITDMLFYVVVFYDINKVLSYILFRHTLPTLRWHRAAWISAKFLFKHNFIWQYPSCKHNIYSLKLDFDTKGPQDKLIMQDHHSGIVLLWCKIPTKFADNQII